MWYSLGNGNLRLTIPMKARGERQGGATRRLGSRNEAGERAAIGRVKDSPDMKPSGGNKGRKMGKDGRGMVEERREPGAVAPVKAGHLDQTMHG
jgi:hypothetical protein